MGQPKNTNSGTGKNLDAFFRETIGEQEIRPSPRVWRNLQWKLLARELIHFNFTNVSGLALVSVSAGLILLASLTYWVVRPDGSTSVRATGKSFSSAAIQPATTTPSVQPVLPVAKVLAPANSPVQHSMTPSALVASNRKINQAVPASEPEASPYVNTRAITENHTVSTAIQLIDPLLFTAFDLAPLSDTIRFIRSGEVFSYIHEKMPVTSFFSADLGVAPEVALYSSGGASTKEFNYWFNAGIAYHYSRFSIRSGVGLGQTSDEGIYRIEYRSNDSVSYYKEVTGFYPDPLNPSKIIYITKNHTIYDSLTHITDDRTRNRYTYLQIPLLLGYTVYETSRISIGFEAGPAFSFLINEKKAQPVIDIPNGRLIKLQDNSLSRQAVNWQLWVNLSISYQFTKNWGLMINPYYKYYLTSPTQTSETGNRSAQAFGLDVGIQYLFGSKKNKK